MTKICCKVTAIPETVKSQLMGYFGRVSSSDIGSKRFCDEKGNCIVFAENFKIPSAIFLSYIQQIGE